MYYQEQNQKYWDKNELSRIFSLDLWLKPNSWDNIGVSQQVENINKFTFLLGKLY